ncbi:MAG: type II secretion system F family protein [Acidimicrobiia bacterium]|nr:type II secretion system F family protein [Acidimicrobiia bacterium]
MPSTPRAPRTCRCSSSTVATTSPTWRSPAKEPPSRSASRQNYSDANTLPIATVVVVDTSVAMDESGALTAVRDGLPKLIAEKPDDQLVGVINAGDSADVITGLSSNRENLEGAVDQLAPSSAEAPALWSGVTRAARMLQDRPAAQPNIVVISTGRDAGGGSASAAIGAAISSGATTWAVGVETEGASTANLDELVGQTGGSVQAADTGDLADTVTRIEAWLVEDQYLVPFSSNRTDGVVPLTVAAPGSEPVETAYLPGRFSQGAQALQPYQESGGGFSVPILSGDVGLYLGVVLALLAVTGLVYALFLLASRDEGELSNVLSPYSEVQDPDAFDEAESGFAHTQLVQRAVAMTEQVAESRGYLSRTEAALERANLPLRAGEALFFYVASVVVLTVLGFVLLGNLVGGLVLGVLISLIPPGTVAFLANRRRKAFLSLLPDTLQLLSGTLRAGYSLMQGVEAVAQEVSEPMGKELRRVVTESRLGRPLEESLEAIAERMASPDFAWAVMAIRIQREVGGNLSELLMTVAETMIARERLRRDVNSLTAEGRVSAFVLVGLPIGLGLIMYIINPGYMSSLFSTTLGNILIGLGVLAYRRRGRCG